MAAISLRRARVMFRKTFETGKEMGLNPLSAVVLDAGQAVM